MIETASNPVQRGIHEQQQADPILRRLIAWAGQRDQIRAMLLTSTRASPTTQPDSLSDYDVIVVTTDIRSFHTERAWLADFGEVLVTYWDPIHPDPDYGVPVFSNVIQYADGLKIDFSLWPLTLLEQICVAPQLPAELDAGYLVLVDKDQLTAGLQAPSHQAYIPERPSEEIFLRVVEEFLSDAPYVAKCLRRHDLLPAKWALDYDMKHVYLRPMLVWRVELEHGWALRMDTLGKGLQKYLPQKFWSQLEDTYVGANGEDNWAALFATIRLYGQVATEVAAGLGYRYPQKLEDRVVAYLHTLKKQ